MEATSTMMAGQTVGAETTIARARRGDLEAFEELYRAHVSRILALCLRMSGDRSRAEELTQESFVRAFERLGTFRAGEEAGFAAWLRRVAINVVLSDRRGLARRRWKERPARDDAPAPKTTESTTGIDLERAIRTLPPGARHVFVLHDIEGRAHGEIATLLGVSAGTSKAQLHRARRLLREALRR